MVQSARVQKGVKGDDLSLIHQIMGDVAYEAELSRAPVTLDSGDSVNFFYELQDPATVDLIGYPGVAVGSYPTSIFTVAIAGDIPEANPVPERGSKTFKSGLGLTVRAEITRQSGKKESYYLFNELDLLERGFPVQQQILNLP